MSESSDRGQGHGTAAAAVWEEGTAPDRPPLEGEVRADVCVVGLGGSGLSAILELLAMGVSVVGIDAATVGGGAAGRNGGFLLAGLHDFYHDAIERLGGARARQVYLLTLAEIDRITAQVPEEVRRTGSLRIAASAAEVEDCRRQLAVMRADELPAEWYQGPEGEGLLIPSDGVFNPLRRCRTLAELAERGGAMLHERSPALRLGGGVVETPHGRVACRSVIVAVDGRLEALLPELTGRVRTARLQMLATPPTEPRFTRPVYARWGFEYWQQLRDGSVALGGFRDHGGDAEWTSDSRTSAAVQERLERFLRERLHVDAPITHRWAAPVGFTTSGLPLLEEVRPGVWATGGYCGTGNVIGAICGRAAARLALGGDTPLRLVAERS